MLIEKRIQLKIKMDQDKIIKNNKKITRNN